MDERGRWVSEAPRGLREGWRVFSERRSDVAGGQQGGMLGAGTD